MNTEIDFNPPTHQIDEVLFDVALQDVYSNFQIAKTQTKYAIGTPYYKAIVNQENGQILSVVGNSYRLITNKEALQIGKYLFCTIYPMVKSEELIPYKVVAPESKASVHIDLIHKDVNFNVWEQETWLPFLRVSNSYNRTCALSFEIGFVRKLCSNGMLFKKETMKLKYIHSKSDKMNINEGSSMIEAYSKTFTNQCVKLNQYLLPHELMFALVCTILGTNLKEPEQKQAYKKMNQLDNLYNAVKSLTLRYSKGADTNAYTALNIATDLVSHQKMYKNLTGYYLNVKSFYTRPSDWMTTFSEKISNNNFKLLEYLEPTITSLNVLKNKYGFEWHLN